MLGQIESRNERLEKEKWKICTFAIFLCFSACLLCAPSVAFADENDGACLDSSSTRVNMLRLYNQWTGEHFYTSSTTEKEILVKAGWKDEGTGWIAPSSGTPVYRLYNRYVSGGDHHYTTDSKERDKLVKAGWKNEGTGWYSASDGDSERVAIYREYNPNATTGTHNYTISKSEHDHLVDVGWKGEGVGWYGYQTNEVKAETHYITVKAPSDDVYKNETSSTLEYDQLTNPKNSSAITKINSVIKNSIDKSKAGVYGYSNGAVNITTRYIKVSYLDQDIVCFKDNGYYFSRGGAHGVYDRASVAFDLKTGAQIDIATHFGLTKDKALALIRPILKTYVTNHPSTCCVEPQYAYNNAKLELTNPIGIKLDGASKLTITEYGLVYDSALYELHFYAAGAPSIIVKSDSNPSLVGKATWEL